MIIEGNCRDVLPKVIEEYGRENVLLVSDPPFNIGYHYGRYKDSMPEGEYWKFMGEIFSQAPSAIVHYPDGLHRISIELGTPPTRVVSWVYNSNTGKQHRDIAFYGVSPDFRKVRQPYKNPSDRRIARLIEAGNKGARLYDWWNVNQVKNVNRVKTGHPCQMPLQVMENIIGILPDKVIIDPFCGSGTTGVACLKYGRRFIGIEIDAEYCRISRERIEQAEKENDCT